MRNYEVLKTDVLVIGGGGAGADVINMEMTLYYPAAFAWPEPVRGVLFQYETILAKNMLDFRLVNKKGKEFIPDGPLLVWDTLMRLMFTEVEEGRESKHSGCKYQLSNFRNV